ncbi:hypothetical protein Pelo_13729 [Pelomyxa schiedti]|nr:hypothetical protein Pelo_13729 [Pelomyxa schiedti]
MHDSWIQLGKTAIFSEHQHTKDAMSQVPETQTTSTTTTSTTAAAVMPRGSPAKPAPPPGRNKKKKHPIPAAVSEIHKRPPPTPTPTPMPTASPSPAPPAPPETASASAAAPPAAKRRRRHHRKPELQPALILPPDPFKIAIPMWTIEPKDSFNWPKAYKREYSTQKQVQIYSTRVPMTSRMEPEQNMAYNDRITAYNKERGENKEFTLYWLEHFVNKKPRSLARKAVVICGNGSESHPGTCHWPGFLEETVAINRILIAVADYFPEAQLFLFSCPHGGFADSNVVAGMQSALQFVASKRGTPVWLAGHIGDVQTTQELSMITSFIQYESSPTSFP